MSDDSCLVCFCSAEDGPCSHKSDCAVHNEPAEPNGECTCGYADEVRSHYSYGRRYSHISNAWVLEKHWNDREQVASLTARLASTRNELEETKQALRIALEDLREERAANGQFGVGA